MYKLEGWSSVSCKCLEVDQRNVAHLLQALSLVELTDIEWRGWSCYSSLWLGGEAVTRELLVAVAVQEWPITSVKLFGNLQNVTADSLCEFFERIHGVDGGAEVRNISILDFELPDGVICDRLINAMHSRLSQFYVLPSLLSVSEISITEQSLHRLFVPNMDVFLPRCSHLSCQHLESSIKRYLETAWESDSNGILNSNALGKVIATMSVTLVNWDASLSDLSAMSVIGYKEVFVSPSGIVRVRFISDTENILKEVEVTLLRVGDETYASLLKGELCLSDDESTLSLSGDSDSELDPSLSSSN
uniref:F-box domain-containing protein n=1 Tax=Parascaris univalens TaxID=6257 RepID=A0A915BK67_PARUN